MPPAQPFALHAWVPDSEQGNRLSGQASELAEAVARCMGAGAMGAVYEVIHRETRRRRALKVMLPSVVSDPELRARFKLEATVTADVESEHIAEIFDAGDATTSASAAPTPTPTATATATPTPTATATATATPTPTPTATSTAPAATGAAAAEGSIAAPPAAPGITPPAPHVLKTPPIRDTLAPWISPPPSPSRRARPAPFLL